MPNIRSLPVELGAFTNVPIHESHKRGKNWLAVITPDPRSPGGIGRAFATRAYGKYYYIVPPLEPGDAIEFGADYYTGGGRKVPRRWYGVVREVGEHEVVVEQCDTAFEAFE